MIAFSAGGRSAAIWSELNPPQELPIIPTLPVHQGWAASHAIGPCRPEFLRRVFVVHEPVGVAGASHVHPEAA